MSQPKALVRRFAGVLQIAGEVPLAAGVPLADQVEAPEVDDVLAMDLEEPVGHEVG